MEIEKTEKGLVQFIRRELFRERTSPVTCFVLLHTAAGGKAKQIDDFNLRGESYTPESDIIPRLAADILYRAQDYADGVASGVQRFQVAAGTQGDARGGARFAFNLRSSVEDDIDAASEEPGTARGIIAQQMRHNEALMRVNASMMGQAISTMARQMENQTRQLEAYEKRRIDDAEARERMLSEEHEREMQLLQLSKREERNDKVFEKVMALAPVVVNRMTGKKLLGDGKSEDPLVMILRDLGKSLSQDQIQAIARTLAPEQMIQFAEVMRSVTQPTASANGTNGVKEN